MKKSKEPKKESRFAFKANCEVVLGEPELKQCGKALADAINRRKGIEGTIDTFRAQKKAELAAVDADIERNTVLLNTGREFRMVECQWDYDWKAGTKKGRRLDTGEVIMQGDINDSERQTHLPGTEEPMPSGAKS